jgi:hypothetical protein
MLMFGIAHAHSTYTYIYVHKWNAQKFWELEEKGQRRSGNIYVKGCQLPMIKQRVCLKSISPNQAEKIFQVEY